MTASSTRAYPPKPEAVYFFGTCLVDVIYPQAGLAAIDLIEREGIRVSFPQGQTCCGQPPFNSGYRDEARRVAELQMRLLPGRMPVVVPSGSCGAMMRVHYPHLFAGTPLELESGEFAARVFEWSEFMLNVARVRWQDRGQPVSVALHPSCHLLRELNAGDGPPALLQQLERVRIQALEGAEECCGFGGTFSVKFDAISGALVQAKCRNIENSGAEILLTADSGCLMNIAGALKRAGSRVAVKPLAQFIRERVDGT